MEAQRRGPGMLDRWARFIDSLYEAGIATSGDAKRIFEELDGGYTQAHRHYHNWFHIALCLDELEAARSLATSPIAVEMAVWFHDAVYIPGAPDNERLSAEMAQEAAESLHLPPAIVREVADLVLATQHLSGEKPTGGPDGSLIRDIDLSIFGQTPQQFNRYEEGIRLEYASVPDRRRWERRLAVLEMFLSLRKIYETGYFRARYEQQARRNLERSTLRLRRLIAG